MFRTWAVENDDAVRQTLVDNLEMTLAKTSMEIARAYLDLVPAGEDRDRIWTAIEREHERSVRAVLAIVDTPALLDSQPVIQRSIQLRNPYVDPMNLLQVDLLRRWRESGRQDRDLFEGLLACTAGIAEGLQSTG